MKWRVRGVPFRVFSDDMSNHYFAERDREENKGGRQNESEGEEEEMRLRNRDNKSIKGYLVWIW